MSLQTITKPTIRYNIAIYQCERLTKKYIMDLTLRVEQHLPILRGMHVKGIAFSLKGVETIDKEGLEVLIDKFKEFHVKLRSAAGLVDYPIKLFPVLEHFVKDTPMGLYRTTDIMALALGTSSQSNFSSVLVHTEDVESRQNIVSTLISNNYFAVMAMSKQDLLNKLKDKNRFAAIVTHSYFSNITEEFDVKFEDNVYNYDLKGALQGNIKDRISLEDFEYRLSLKYKIFILNFEKVYYMEASVAHLILELDRLAQEHKGHVCVINIDSKKIDRNALAVLENSTLWVYDTYVDVIEDQDIIPLITRTSSTYHYSGITKPMLNVVPKLIASSVKTLEIFGIKDTKKLPSKRILLRDLSDYKPTIVSHIGFMGDYEGDIIFLFGQGSSELLITHILGDFAGAEGEDFLDAMNEFVNSVTGTMKSALKRERKCIQFTIPKSVPVLSDICPEGSDQTAVLATFECNEQPFYVAFTHPIL